MDAAEIIQLLNDKAEEFCSWLLPQGKRSGQEWCVGNLTGDAGASLKIRLAGDKIGVWNDFAGDEKGSNLVTLLMRVRGTVSWGKSLCECKEWLGLPVDEAEDRFYRQRERNSGKFQTAANDHAPLDQNGPVYRYLRESRGLSADTLSRYKVRQHKTSAAIAFAQATPDGKAVAFVKYVDLRRSSEGKKIEWTDPKGAQPGIWGKHAVTEGEDEVIVTEGEIDALSVGELGFAGVSAPMGAMNDQWIDVDWRWLEQFRSVVLLFDNDPAGEKAASQAMQKLINRLGRARCRLGLLPPGIKDANEALLKGRSEELHAAIRNAKSLDPAELKSVADYRQQTYELLFPDESNPAGKPFFLPTKFIKTRPGEITLWTGINSHGKTTALLHNAVHLADLGERVLIACMEAPPHETARILCQQVNGGEITGREEFERVWSSLEPHFWIYDSQECVKAEPLLHTFEYAFRRYGVTQFVIDSFMTLGVQKDDYSEQSRIMDLLRLFAIKFNVHVHLVAHSRKGKDESEPPGKMDVSGHADITNKAFNGFTLWRNKKKEKNLAQAMEAGNAAEYERIDLAEHDAELICWKQRKTGHEPMFKLWFDKFALQYTFKPHQGVRRYLARQQFQVVPRINVA